MTSSNGNVSRVTGPLCGEFTGHRWIPSQRPVTRSFEVFFDLQLKKSWVNNHEAGDLRRHRAHYDVTVMRNYQADPLNDALVVSTAFEFGNVSQADVNRTQERNRQARQQNG